MATPALTEKECRDTVREVENALREGYFPLGHPIGKGDVSAIKFVTRKMGYKTDRATRDRIIAAEERFGLVVNWGLYKKAKGSETEPAAPKITDREEHGLRRENAELRAKLAAIHRDSLDTQAIREILGGFVATPVNPPKWTTAKSPHTKDEHVPMTIWSDWHAGEVVSGPEVNGVNEYNLEIFERRVKRLVERTIYLTRDHGPGRYPGIVINLLGDFVSGALHPELAKTDEEEVLPTALRVRDILVWALEQMLAEFGSIYAPCVSGNHGRQTQKPEAKRYVFKNFDWLIYQLLARHFQGRKDITFDIPESNEVHYRVYNKRFLAMHGDMMGVKGGDGIIGSLGPIMRGETKVGKQLAAIGRDYDFLLMGHWHQEICVQRIIVANTLKGFDEFAHKFLRASPSLPSQPLWYMHEKYGRVDYRQVYLEDPEVREATPWVSVFKGVS